MRVIDVFLIILLALAAIYLLTMRWAKERAKKKRQVKVYFSGGPLDKKGRYLTQVPSQYAFLYKTTELVTEKSRYELSQQQTEKLAIYNHQGNGVYLYQGSVKPEDALDYDSEVPNAIE